MTGGVHRGGIAHGTALLLVAAVAFACNGGSGGSNQLNFNGSGFTSTNLAEGTVNLLPDGTLIIRIDQVSQVPAAPAASGPPGIVYVTSGSLTLTDRHVVVAGTFSKDSAVFAGPSMQVSSADATTGFDYFSVGTSSTRTGPGPYGVSQALYATPDLPSLPIVNQHEALVETTLQNGGFSPAHRPNGVEVLLDLQGTMDLSLGGRDVKHMKTGDAIYELQGSFIQLINRGSGVARYLSFFLVPSGMPLTTKA